MMADSGNQLDLLYSCVLHFLFLIVGMITGIFIGAPALTRALLFLTVSLNFAAKYNRWDAATLNFTSMTILILALTAGMCYLTHLTVWLCWVISARETRAVMPAYEVGSQKNKRTTTTAILKFKPRNQHRFIFCRGSVCMISLLRYEPKTS
jgi:hypothetical protein